MTNGSAERNVRRRFILILVAACACFLPVLWGDFLDWDDKAMVVDNPAMAAGRLPDALASWGHPVLELYAPLTYTVYAALSAVSRAMFQGFEPSLFHAANLTVHAASAVLTWFLLRRLTRDDFAAMLGALIWTVHPMQVEPVAWIGSLNTDLCTMLAIAAMGAAVTAIETTPRWPWKPCLAAGGLMVLSLCAKPATIGLPLAVLGVSRFVLGQTWRRSLTVSVAAAALAVPFIVIGQAAQPPATESHLPAFRRATVMGQAAAFYLYKAVVPWPLSIDYGFDPATVLASPTARLAGLALLPVVALLIWQRRRRPWLIGAACVAAAGIAPVSGVRDFTFQTFSTVADRYANFALIGLAIVVAFTLRGATIRSRRAWAAFLIAGLFAGMTLARGFDWRDTRTLETATLAANPQSLLAMNFEGGYAERAGDYAREAEIGRQILARRPMDYRTNRSMAYLLLLTNHPADAVGYFRRALSIRPDAGLFSALGLALANSGRLPAALDAAEQAIRLDPGDASLHANQGELYRRMNEGPQALESFKTALRIDPNDRAAADGIRQLRAESTRPASH